MYGTHKFVTGSINSCTGVSQTPVTLVLVEIDIYSILHLAWTLFTIAILGPHGFINSCYLPVWLSFNHFVHVLHCLLLLQYWNRFYAVIVLWCLYAVLWIHQQLPSAYTIWLDPFYACFALFAAGIGSTQWWYYWASMQSHGSINRCHSYILSLCYVVCYYLLLFSVPE